DTPHTFAAIPTGTWTVLLTTATLTRPLWFCAVAVPVATSARSAAASAAKVTRTFTQIPPSVGYNPARQSKGSLVRRAAKHRLQAAADWRSQISCRGGAPRRLEPC